MRRLLLSLTLAGLAVSAVGASGASAATVRMVDGDGKASPGNCDSSAKAYKTVQAAVTAASAGDTVLVCPGTYPEKVVIGPAKDRLTLRSVGHLDATIKAPASVVGGQSIIFIKHGADRVTIKDFAIRYPTRALGTAGTDCGAIGAIRVDAANARIESNNIAATGPSTAVCGIGYGIFVGYGPDGDSARIRYNIVRDTMDAGIVVGDPGNTMTAFRNQVRYHHAGQQIINSAASRAAHRGWRAIGTRTPAGIRATYGGGIVVFFGASATIRENTVEGSLPGVGPLSDNPGAYLRVGISVESAVGATVSANRVYRSNSNIFVGTGLNPTQTVADVVVEDNIALSGFFGIEVDAEGALIDGNQASGNVVGLFADSSSSGNSFTDNRAYSNLDIDCVDQTSDDIDTLLNTWTGNQGNSDSPTGICIGKK